MLSFLHLGGRDWIVLLLSLALSSTIWLIHSLSEEYSGVMTVPVEAESKIEGRSNISTLQSVAVARVRTSGFNLVRALGRERRKPVRVKVDPQDLRRISGDDFILTGAARSNYVRGIFGDGAVLLREIPADVDPGDARESLSELAQRLLEGRRTEPAALRDELLHTVACKAAIKAGWDTQRPELEKIVSAVLSGAVLYCPHGRPVSSVLTRRDLDKLFKRIV